MAVTDFELHAGTGFPVPRYDASRPPRGEVTWVQPDERAVSTSGPALQLAVDLYLPAAAGREQFVVARLRDVHGYLPTKEPSYRDPDDNLSVTATVSVPFDGSVEQVAVVLPYVCLPPGVGGLLEAEIAVHEADGELTALASYPVELPEELERSPDLLSVMAHTLVAMARATGGLGRDEVRTIRAVLTEQFGLDDLGDQALRRILKVANRAEHTPETLAEVIGIVVPEDGRDRFVELLYAGATVDGQVAPRTQRFVDRLLEACGIHDHRRRGPAGLSEHFAELEVEPGADLATVKKAYRRLVKDYHPDRVAHLAQGFQDYANDKVRRLNDAWHAVRDALEDADTGDRR